MAKKTKKKRSATSPRLTESQLYQPGRTGTAHPRAGVKASSEAASSRIPNEEELRGEYRYVLTDLKKIAWLALAMLILLVVLAMVIV